MLYFAIDIGSTRLKCAVIDLERCCISRQRTVLIPGVSLGLTHETNAETLYKLVRELVEQAVRVHGAALSGVRISSQMHGFLLAEPNGRTLTPYISWQDNRCLGPHPCGGNWLASLAQQLPEGALQCAGLPLKPGLPLCNAYTLCASQSFPSGSLFCTLGSYLSLRLTGGHATHLSMAGSTGCANVVRGVWNSPVIEAAGLKQFLFPALLNEHEPAGLFRFAGCKVPIFADVGDQQMAVLGSLMRPVEDVNLNIATAAQMARIATEFSSGNYETRPFFGGSYLNTVTRMPSGRNLDVLVQFMEHIGTALFDTIKPRQELFERVSSLAEHASELSEDLPLQVGIGFYRDMLDGNGQGGSVDGIVDGNLTVGNLFAAAYASMAEAYARHFSTLDNGLPVQRLVATGSVALKDAFLMRLVSQRLGLPIDLSPTADEVLLGHYRLFLLDAGVCRTLEESAHLAASALADSRFESCTTIEE